MELTIQTLTPLFIGSGEELESFRYFVDNGKIKIINFDKAVEDLQPSSLDAILGEIRQFAKADELFGREGLEVVRELEVYSRQEWRSHIRLFIKQKGRPFIPASSIKGAVKTALFWNEKKDDRDFVRDIGDRIKQIEENLGDTKEERETNKRLNSEILNLIKEEINKFSNALNREIMGKFDKIDIEGTQDYVRIGDFDFEEFSMVACPLERFGAGTRAQRKRARLGGLEVVKPTSIARGSIEFDIRLKNLEGFDERQFVRDVFTKINEFSAEVAAMDLKVIDSILNDLGEQTNARQVMEKIEKLYTLARGYISAGSDACLLPLGFGGGYYSKTIASLIVNSPHAGLTSIDLRKKLRLGHRHRRNASFFPATFPLAMGLPLGWVKLSLVE